MRRWGETIVRWVRTVLKFQERPWWPRGTGIDENGEGRPDGDRERERGLRAARGGGVGVVAGMGFETERSDEAGRCGLGDWELGSAEAGRRRRPTELGTGTDRTGFAKREQPNWPFGVVRLGR